LDEKISKIFSATSEKSLAKFFLNAKRPAQYRHGDFMENYGLICDKILEDLPLRHKEIIARRFGLGREPETLEEIGENYEITRERVRQIEADAVARLESEKEDRDLKKIFFDFESYLKNQGGVKREDIILKELGGEDFKNQVYFILYLGEPFARFSENENFYPFWGTHKNIFDRVEKVVNNLIVIFEKEKRPLPEQEFFSFGKGEQPNFFVSSVEISKHIEKGPLGEFGLVSWPEIKPKGVRDRAYLALRREAKPLHFREIAGLAGALEGDVCARKQVYPQTVHNELIKDPRFILVGRGIYALSDWGYTPGTVKETILAVLENSPQPLSKEEVISEVLSKRLVKENTVFLNLQDKKLFQKNNEGKYLPR